VKSSLVLAVDLGGTKLACAAAALDGRILARRVEPVDTRSTQSPVEQMVRIARELGGEFGSFRSAGIAVPGLVRPNGTVWAPNLPRWKALPLARLVKERLHIPVVVESDRNCAVLGEAWRGAARGKRDVVVLVVGTGIGAGILISGQVIRGAHELSGCAGWMVINEADCRSFHELGMLEALVAGPAIAKLGGKQSALELAEAARNGDASAREIFRVAGRRLGLAVANLVSLFDPQVVVVGGGLAGAAELFIDELKRTALSRTQPLAAKQVQIRVSKLGGNANLLGAARVALNGAR